MAQAQAGASTRSRTQRKKASARSRGSTKSSKRKRTSSKPKSASSKPKSASSKPKSASSNNRGKQQASSKPSPVDAVENAAKDAGRTAKDAGKTVGRAASKAKVPLLAGGAALAGAAGGIALGAHQAHRHKGIGGKVGGKVKSQDVAKAARRVGQFGAQMGHLASELQRAREDSNGNGRHRSPIEIVLEGLTARRSRA
jgi:hypothetical protein